MDGFRGTSTGDTRILENGDVRITENTVVAEASLTAAGVFSSNGLRSTPGTASFTALGTLAAEGIIGSTGETYLTAQVSLAVSENMIMHPEASLGASTEITASPTMDVWWEFAATAASSISADGRVTRFALVPAASVSSLSANGLATRNAEVVLSSSSSMTALSGYLWYGLVNFNISFDSRITELGDIRVTEDGQPRISPTMAVTSSFSENSVHIPFTRQFYVYDAFSGLVISIEPRVTESGDIRVSEDGEPRVSEMWYYTSEWKDATPYIKDNSSWMIPEKGYYKNNGAWRRVW